MKELQNASWQMCCYEGVAERILEDVLLVSWHAGVTQADKNELSFAHCLDARHVGCNLAVCDQMAVVQELLALPKNIS